MAHALLLLLTAMVNAATNATKMAARGAPELFALLSISATAYFLPLQNFLPLQKGRHQMCSCLVLTHISGLLPVLAPPACEVFPRCSQVHGSCALGAAERGPAGLEEEQSPNHSQHPSTHVCPAGPGQAPQLPALPAPRPAGPRPSTHTCTRTHTHHTHTPHTHAHTHTHRRP